MLITYTVTNTGVGPLHQVVVTDSVHGTPIYRSGDTNADGRLDVGETWLYTLVVSAGDAGDNRATGTATATGPATINDNSETVPGEDVSDSDGHHFYVVEPGASIVKTVNGADADATPGPHIAIGDPVTWTYAVTNTGNAALANITVTDDPEGATTYRSGDTDNDALLDIGETWLFELTGIAREGQYTNTGVVDGVGPQTVDVDGTRIPGRNLNDTNPANYFGARSTIDVTKQVYIDNTCADTATVAERASVRWVIKVTNTGNTILEEVVIDDRFVEGCRQEIATLAPGATFTFQCEQIVTQGYTNTVIATAQASVSGVVIASVNDTSDASVTVSTGGARPSGILAFTGSNLTRPLATAGGALLVVGGVLLVAARRRRRVVASGGADRQAK